MTLCRRAALALIAGSWLGFTPISSLAGDDETHPLSLTATEETPSSGVAVEDKPWHLEFGFRDSYTKLHETKEMLDQRLDIPLSLGGLNFFDEPRTPLDRKSEFLLTTFYLGAGRQESDWLIWTVSVGGGMGRDHDHQRLANLNLEVNFKYSYVYTNATAEIYPWKAPRRGDFEDWKQGISASRPFLAAGLETGYVSAEGRGYYKIVPFPRIYQDKAQVRDWITSLNLGAGWNFPINHSWSFVLMGDYRFHAYRPDEYNGWTLTTAMRYTLP